MGVPRQMKTIGIVGGVGPYAGLDLAKKIFDNTEAQHDQEPLDVLLVNSPRLIDDRTAYILAVRDGKVATDPATDPANPGRGIVACIRKLAAAGAEVVGVPCNTAHAPLIFDVVEREVAAQLPGIRLLQLVRETGVAVCAFLPQGGTIGLLATPGTYASGVYQTYVAYLPCPFWRKANNFRGLFVFLLYDIATINIAYIKIVLDYNLY